MKSHGLYMVLMIVLAVGAARSQNNPFEAAKRFDYSGVFDNKLKGAQGETDDGLKIMLVLCERGENYDGTLVVDGIPSLLTGKLALGVFLGSLRNQDGTVNGNVKIVFEDGGKVRLAYGHIDFVLARRPGVPFKGVFEGGEVKFSLVPGEGDALTGDLKFNGKTYPVLARANGALCWGTFGNGNDVYPFTFIREYPAGALVRFTTGSFSQLLVDLRAVKYRLSQILKSMVRIPAGSFMMGDKGIAEKRLHRATISQPFYLGKFEVTQEQWEAVMGANPSHFKGTNLPVEMVSWEDCQKFIEKLNSKGLGTFRLPTEAEWEYACRAGTTGKYAGNLDELSWYWENSDKKTHPVGTKKANPWGLYDMHGNVSEWCQDLIKYRADSPDCRIYRGGSWDGDESFCRSATRLGVPPSGRYNMIGFRLVRMVP